MIQISETAHEVVIDILKDNDLKKDDDLKLVHKTY
jgi:hypothetical protein